MGTLQEKIGKIHKKKGPRMFWKRIFRVFVVALVMCMLGGLAQAGKIEVLTDKFYSGLTAIIERNMDAPDRCVEEVENYYQKNQKTIELIRKEAEKGMEQARREMEKEMDKMMSMSNEEREACMRKKAEDAEKRMSLDARRYNQALKAFMDKYPSQGMKVGLQAMRFIPMESMMDFGRGMQRHYAPREQE